MKRFAAFVVMLVAATFGDGVLPPVAARDLQPTPHCWVWYYLQDGGRFDHVDAGCQGLQPDYMVRVQAYLALRHDGVLTNVWVSGPWIDCNWQAAYPHRRLSTVRWLADGSGEQVWTGESTARFQLRTDNDTTGC